MTTKQRKDVLRHIANGATWPNACDLGNVKFYHLFEELYKGRHADAGPEHDFVRDIEEAGRQATKKGLNDMKQYQGPLMATMEI